MELTIYILESDSHFWNSLCVAIKGIQATRGIKKALLLGQYLSCTANSCIEHYRTLHQPLHFYHMAMCRRTARMTLNQQ
ncbi:hypothetical protein SAMN04487941_1923 [Pontibacter akesuensis]|uniref:Uncharacterized protein n=1 Tax=Pontibacter akesuensis TaxID=388950 RepID=A0A1I7I569_9BACT|nr:hypothetical protein SAMN04487941_1923 [Pontibacter akesuensis]